MHTRARSYVINQTSRKTNVSLKRKIYKADNHGIYESFSSFFVNNYFFNLLYTYSGLPSYFIRNPFLFVGMFFILHSA